jgi:hypothetical protein
VSTSQKRDADTDRLLRAVLKPTPRKPDPAGFESGAGECPEAGLLAAFVEGTLTANEQSALDAHIAHCGLCQEALAVLSRDMPEAEPAAPATVWFTWVTQPRLRWLVPISAAATIAVIFFATRPLIAPENQAPAAAVTQMAQAPSTPPAPPVETLDALRETPGAVPKREATSAAAGKDAAGSLSGVKSALETREARIAPEKKRAQPAATAPAPPAGGGQAAVAQRAANVPAAAEAANTQPAARADRIEPSAAGLRKEARSLEAGLATVAAPGGMVVWRLGPGGRLARSVDAGATWHAQASGVTADLLAGAAPSQATCWVVGASGTVLHTTDGERWERRPFPDSADLVAVSASSARAAIVTALDGRRFETLDAGLTWSPR